MKKIIDLSQNNSGKCPYCTRSLYTFPYYKADISTSYTGNTGSAKIYTNYYSNFTKRKASVCLNCLKKAHKNTIIKFLFINFVLSAIISYFICSHALVPAIARHGGFMMLFATSFLLIYTIISACFFSQNDAIARIIEIRSAQKIHNNLFLKIIKFINCSPSIYFDIDKICTDRLGKECRKAGITYFNEKRYRLDFAEPKGTPTANGSTPELDVRDVPNGRIAREDTVNPDMPKKREITEFDIKIMNEMDAGNLTERTESPEGLKMIIKARKYETAFSNYASKRAQGKLRGILGHSSAEYYCPKCDKIVTAVEKSKGFGSSSAGNIWCWCNCPDCNSTLGETFFKI